MNNLEFLKSITAYAKKYRLEANDSITRNFHMNNATGNDIPQEDIDALLVDFINFVGMSKCLDFGLYTSDIDKE